MIIFCRPRNLNQKKALEHMLGELKQRQEMRRGSY